MTAENLDDPTRSANGSQTIGPPYREFPEGNETENQASSNG